MKLLLSILPGGLVCAFRGHQFRLAQIIGCRLTAKWCSTCDRVEWID